MSMVFCRGCGKEIHESATTCPQCGAQQEKQSEAAQVAGKPWGTVRMMIYGAFSFFAPLIGLIAGIIGLTKAHTRKQGWILLGLAVAGMVMYASISGSMRSDSLTAMAKGDGEAQPAAQFADLAAASPATIKPTGELAAMFNMMSDNTDLQREDKIKELKGKVIEWNLEVYEVSREDDAYKIQTGGDDEVGTFIHLSARDEAEKKRIEALKTGDRISVKGVIKDTFLRSFVIKPAILFSSDAIKVPLAQQKNMQASDWPHLNVASLIGKGASTILSDPVESKRYSMLGGRNDELDEYLMITVFDDEEASAIQDEGEYLVIFSKGVVRRDTGPMDGAYAIHKTSGKPAAILEQVGKFTLVGATAQTLPPPLKKWALEKGAAL